MVLGASGPATPLTAPGSADGRRTARQGAPRQLICAHQSRGREALNDPNTRKLEGSAEARPDAAPALFGTAPALGSPGGRPSQRRASDRDARRALGARRQDQR